MSPITSEAAVLSSLLLDPPPVLMAPTLLRALGLVERPEDDTAALLVLDTTPECAA
ncbi:hypothetical protein ABZW02_25745 [Streptomyces sp. NPDC005180]|uniref:hypothetical protein n=1 Tax=Streptomyces sp. NPDC005180 TaxID=3156868 RepID=UPI00339DF325